MRNALRDIVIVSIGAVAGAGITFFVMHSLDRFPSHSYMSKDYNAHVRTVVGEQLIREWKPSAGFDNKFIYAGKVVVYPVDVRPMLVLGGVFISTNIGVRPLHFDGTVEDACEIWEAATLEERTKAYEFVCSAIVNDFSYQCSVDKSKVMVHFGASTIYPAVTMPSQFPRDGGTFESGTMKMSWIANRQQG